MKEKIPSFLLTFLLSLTLLIMVFLIIINKTILNEKYILKNLEETNYYSKIYQDLITETQDYITQSGLEELRVSELFTEDRVKKDVNDFINYLYTGKNYQSKEDLILDLEKKLNESNIDLSAEDKKLVEASFQNLTNNYASIVVYDAFSGVVPKLAHAINVGKNFVNPILIVMDILIIMSIVGLIGLNKFKGSLKYIGTSFLTVSIIFLSINIFINLNMNLAKLFIFNEAISEIIYIIFSAILKQIKTMGIIFLLSGLILTIISALSKAKVSTK